MNKKFLLISIPLILVVFALSVFAQQQLGCCCDPIVKTGSIMPQSVCMSPFVFVPIPAAGFTGCNALCNATNITAPGVTPAPAACGSPGYIPAVANLAASPVKGQKAVKIDFNVPCPANNVKIYRCAGTGCTNYTLLAALGQVNSYTDQSSDLLWDEEYTYQVVANYKGSGDSAPASVSANLGDIECWYQTTSDIFCISAFYYGQFKDYLKKYGYKIESSASFASDYVQTRDSLFNNFYGKSWFCNAVNKISNPAPQVSCADDEICVSDGQSARCVEQIDCDLGEPFGLFPSLNACEGTAVSKNYCFLDKSKTVVDKCYACDPKMVCYDYHSKSACEKDNCGVGQCAWKDVFPDLGIGVCYDIRFDACSLCQAKPTDTAKNKDAFDEVFNSCTEQKAAALSTATDPCFFDKDTGKGVSCDFADCTDFSQSQCSSPSGGIQLNKDNSIKVASNDPCNIDVCQYSAQTGCVKNANGASGTGWQDCYGAIDPAECEKDYFPPETLVVLFGAAPGKQDYIDFIINDKKSKTGPVLQMQGKPGYKTYLCIESASTPCTDASAFSIVTSKTRLNINDLALQDGTDTIGRFSPGNNKIRYYSVDVNNNPEVVKSVDVFACDQCSGPKALNITVTGANEVAGNYYTRALQPTIKVFFNKPARLTAKSLDIGGTLVSMTTSPSSGLNYQYTFTPSQALSEGRYTFSINTEDNHSVPMDNPVVFSLIIDTTPPIVRISPSDGSEFEVQDVSLALNFSEPVFFNKTTLDEVVFIDEYVKKAFPIYLSKELASQGNKVFSGGVSNLKEGLKIINVVVTDYAGNSLKTRSYFSVLAGPPQIRMMHPSWGITSMSNFNATIETSTKADCRYIYDVPAPPPASQFDSLIKFDSSDGIEHVINSLSIPYGDASLHPLHVYCKAKSGQFNVTMQTFRLSVDSVAPSIVSAYANPDPIVEPVEPGATMYSTRLQVQTDEESFCKYSSSTQDFNEMEGFFPGFDEVPKKSHTVEVNVSAIQAYTYYVACKDKADLSTQTSAIPFHIDLSVPFSIKSATEPYSSTELFSLRVDSNKKAFCYFGETPGGISTCFGSCEFTNGHATPVKKSPGKHLFYVKCNTGGGGETSNVLNVTVFVDTTSPVMTFIDDSSTLPGEPDVSWYLDKLRVKFMGDDPETRIVKYYYLIETAFARELIVNWTPSLELNGSPIYVKANLTNDQRYVFRVKPENIVGLIGNYSSSDGVTIDVAKEPPQCMNGEKNNNETDVDCGGICAGCAIGKNCMDNNDCADFYCAAGVCKEPSCEDGVKNGIETDVDCGGSVCAGCSLNKTCAVDTDCESANCKFGICVLDPCENGILDGSESDVDCGGSCPDRCISGMNCNLPGDCAEDLDCVHGTCGTPLDMDEDGVPDHLDLCPNTPLGVFVDSSGCPVEEEAPLVEEKPSLLWTLLKWLLILAVLGGIGYGGYYAYKKGYLDSVIARFKKKEEEIPEMPEARPEMPKPRPKPKGPSPEERIAALRKFAKKKEAPAGAEEFVPLSELKARKKKAKKTREEKAFEKLKGIKKKKKAAKPKKSKKDVLAKLKKMKKR